MMHRYTQSETEHGNCWQTAVACVLGISPCLLPPQTQLEQLPAKVLDGWGSYSNILNGYLQKHFQLMYKEYTFWEAQALGLRTRFPHILVGPTVRTKEPLFIQHCVAEWYNADPGFETWDPHPSRAGLLEAKSVGVIVSADRRESQREWVGRYEEGSPEKELLSKIFLECLCPNCNLTWVLDRARECSSES